MNTAFTLRIAKKGASVLRGDGHGGFQSTRNQYILLTIIDLISGLHNEICSEAAPMFSSLFFTADQGIHICFALVLPSIYGQFVHSDSLTFFISQ